MPKNPIYALVLIILLGCLIYANIFNAPFHFDDHTLLLQDPQLKNMSMLFEDWNQRKIPTFLTFALNYHFFGVDPASYHIVNVILHMLTATFLYLSIVKLLETPALLDSFSSKKKRLFSLFASLIFLSHPLQTESVTYIWQRSEVVSGLLFVSAYYMWLLGRLNRKNVYYVFSILLFAIGFMDKGTILSLPLVVLLTEISFFNVKKRTQIIKEIRPLLLFLIFVVVLIFFPHEKLHYAFKFYHLRIMNLTGMQLSGIYFFTQFRVVLKYLQLCFIPIGQSLEHYLIMSDTGWNRPTILSFFSVFLILSVAIKINEKHRLKAFGIFWFFICLLPTSFVMRGPIWEHRVYISIIGFALFTAALLFSLIKKDKPRNSAIVVIVCILSMLTIVRNFLWRDPIVLMQDSIKKYPNNPRSYLGLGTLYAVRGKRKEAIEQLEKAIELNPDYVKPYNNLGNLYTEIGHLRKAVYYYNKAIEKEEKFYLPYMNLSYIYMRTGDFSRAKVLLDKAIGYKRTDHIHRAFGVFYYEQGKYEEAEMSFKSSLELNPSNKNSLFGLGNVFVEKKDFASAVTMYQKAVNLDNAFRDAYVNMGIAYFSLGKFNDAKNAFMRAIDIRPSSSVYKNLANTYHELKDFKKAEESYQKSRVLYSPGLRLH